MRPAFLSLSLFVFVFHFSVAQNQQSKEVFRQFDQLVGLENTGLYNGTEFNDPFLNTDGTYRYFKGFDYNKGWLVYSGQVYDKIPLKYDVLDDNLLTHSEDNLGIFVVRLIPEFIDSFSVYNVEFVRLPDAVRVGGGNGFFEKAFMGNRFHLFIKHTKKKREKALKSGLQYRFTDVNFFLIKYESRYFVANSAKDVWKNMPEYSEQIRNFTKTYRQLYKTDRQVFMTKLIGYLDGLNIPSGADR